MTTIFVGMARHRVTIDWGKTREADDFVRLHADWNGQLMVVDIDPDAIDDKLGDPVNRVAAVLDERDHFERAIQARLHMAKPIAVMEPGTDIRRHWQLVLRHDHF